MGSTTGAFWWVAQGLICFDVRLTIAFIHQSAAAKYWTLLFRRLQHKRQAKPSAKRSTITINRINGGATQRQPALRQTLNE